MTRACRHVVRAFIAIAIVLATSTAASAANCSISTTGMSFGTYDVFTAPPLDSTATITYNCSGNADITISISAGGAPSFATRRMLNGTEQLLYNLYPTAAYGTVWGDGTSSSYLFTRNNVPNNTNFNLTVFGRVPAGQDVTAGAYSNTVTVTINY